MVNRNRKKKYTGFVLTDKVKELYQKCDIIIEENEIILSSFNPVSGLSVRFDK